jgi:uncharacterized protein
MTFDPERTLPLIVCPRSHAVLVLENDRLISTDPQTRLRYLIRDGIPVLLIDEAEELPLEEWSQIMRRHGRDPLTGKETESENGQRETV